MKSIKELAPKPSDALQAMVDGLLAQSKREDFKIEMESYGEINDHGTICFGCAATCAIQQIAMKNLPIRYEIERRSFRAEYLELGYRELAFFERAINFARIGDLFFIFQFYNLEKEFDNIFNGSYFLDNDNWKDELPKVEKLIAELKSKGL